MVERGDLQRVKQPRAPGSQQSRWLYYRQTGTLSPELAALERALNGARPAPLDALRLARRRWLAGERIDMGALARELGVSRATLYGWVGSREKLIGEAALGAVIGVALFDVRPELVTRSEVAGIPVSQAMLFVAGGFLVFYLLETLTKMHSGPGHGHAHMSGSPPVGMVAAAGLSYVSVGRPPQLSRA